MMHDFMRERHRDRDRAAKPSEETSMTAFTWPSSVSYCDSAISNRSGAWVRHTATYPGVRVQRGYTQSNGCYDCLVVGARKK